MNCKGNCETNKDQVIECRTEQVKLGLSICKNIIKQMGGTINIESKEGVGNKFIIILSLKAIDKKQDIDS
jgi:K+-sensing histidine kinase KdpD